MTLEEAQAQIVELREQLTEAQTNNTALSQDNEQLRTDNESLRNLNQKYFNKLSALYSDPADKKDDEEKEVPTCEEFAKTLNF